MNCLWIILIQISHLFVLAVFSFLVLLQNVLPLHHSLYEIFVTDPFHNTILFHIAKLHPNLHVLFWWHKFHLSNQSISFCHHFRCLMNRDPHLFFIFVLAENFICMIQYFWISWLLGSFDLFFKGTFWWCEGVFFTWEKVVWLRSPRRKEL